MSRFVVLAAVDASEAVHEILRASANFARHLRAGEEIEPACPDCLAAHRQNGGGHGSHLFRPSRV